MIDLVLLAITEIIAIAFFVGILVRKMPGALKQLADENCHRMDGSLSSRRTRKENLARAKLRTDLWAGFLLAAAATSGLLAAIHTFVVPQFTLQHAFRDYANGLKYRQEQNLYRDLARVEDGLDQGRA